MNKWCKQESQQARTEPAGNPRCTLVCLFVCEDPQHRAVISAVCAAGASLRSAGRHDGIILRRAYRPVVHTTLSDRETVPVDP
jgi:hypothetical protein